MWNSKFSKILALTLLIPLLFAITANAKVDLINPGKGLPRKELGKIQKVIEDLEPMVVNWTPTWSFNVPKDEVEKKLVASYQELDNYTPEYPDNLELALFKGLVAHYAYNLDLKEYYDLAVSSFQQAAAIDPTDHRVNWYYGVHLVKAGQIKVGMEKLLSIIATEPHSQLSFSFWEDFAYCSLVASMPAHVLFGVDQASKIKNKKPTMITTLAQLAHDKLKEPPRDSQLEPDQVWASFKDADIIKFRNRMFGFNLQVPSHWLVQPVGTRNNSVALFIKPPSKTVLNGKVSSTILFLAHQAQPGESINDFTLEMLDPKYSFIEVPSNLDWVKAFEGIATDLDPGEAGAHNYVIVFSRKEPERPGMMLEFPVEIKKANDQAGVSYFRSNDEYTRLPGEIYYFLILDTTESAYQESKHELDLILNGLVVE